MQEETIRAVLRILAVATLLVGLINTTRTIIALVPAERHMEGMPDAVRAMMHDAGYAVLAELVILFFGAALWGASGGLARAIRG